MIPGSPASVRHTPALRAAYLTIGLLVTITSGLGNALVSANLPQIQGTLGLTPVEGAWLPAAYVMVNLSANLVLFKARQQFGIRRFAEIALVAYLAVTALHLFVDDYPTALLVRGASGFVGATLSSLGFYYVMQGFPKHLLGNSIVVAFGLTQLALPLAWLLSPALLDLGDWQTLYLFEFALALCTLAAVVALKLPPGIRVKVIERTDFLTFALLAPAFALIAAVLAQGRLQWWSEQPWMAWALIAAMALLFAAFYIEHHRVNPLIQTRWIGTVEVARFVIASLAFRLILSEQSFAAAGLLRTLGMGPDQFGLFYLVIIAGVLAGIAIGAATFGPKTMMPMAIASIVLVLLASLMDSDATSDTRPNTMMVSQFMVAMAGALVMAPLILNGVMGALKRGPDHIITFVILFTMTQSAGGLIGPALYGTVQQYREHEYSGQMTSHVDPSDPIIARRLAIQRQVYATRVTDPGLGAAQGTALLQQVATREANVRAYNDIFRLNAAIAFIFLLWCLWRISVQVRNARNAPPPAAKAAAGSLM
ncbi:MULTISPECIES: MFS transporter [unclassified Sphingobium]|uniref:MFS transporter n=1 Tax=unclassified Sphingobium TaxID=2611147 RepID=UPI000D17B73F|nr:MULTISPECIES: MFS transporter [unclassified Sphingobium]TWD19906.1 MFS transporter [Sphingobium sp. AEW001]MBG6117369.1 MFS family permease [Sphingobium sp. JAI105]PSO09685.1 MFS transporter [Sphingobium sp. AEW4]TWC97204.1 MFS transporter [Sphingobium sp. AEW010]TWD17384.1 MFS transporter [Sphingobium sp. AEW013]